MRMIFLFVFPPSRQKNYRLPSSYKIEAVADIDKLFGRRYPYYLFFFKYISSTKLIIMATKKSSSKKATTEPTLITKIATQVGQVAGEIVVAKNKLVEKAGQAIDSVKSTIGNITSDKKAAPKKAAPKKTVKAAVKKVVKKAIKKAAPAKKSAKKAVKKVVKKTAPAKTAIKKSIKKVVKKAAVKKGAKK